MYRYCFQNIFFVFMISLIGIPLAYCQSVVSSVIIDGGKSSMLYRYTVPDGYSKDKTYPVLLAPGMGAENAPPNLYFGQKPITTRLDTH